MNIIEKIGNLHPTMTDWRRNIHQHPETAFTEFRTADFIADLLTGFGLEIHRGLAKTGIVATLKVGSRNRSIALRADMDALDIQEKNSFSYKSVNSGKMHACGHDGHCAMLLGAAQYLSETRSFDGTIYFIFQPAEENEGGAQVMIEEGLFTQFPIRRVFGMHNWPQVQRGKFGIRSGPSMAAFDLFEIKVLGKGCHAAMPHTGIDPLLVAAHIVTALQSIVSRNVDPLDSLVVSVTQIHGGETYNVIPDEAVIRGTVRSFSSQNQDMVKQRMTQISQTIAQGFGAGIELDYQKRYPTLVNTEEETEMARIAAAEVVGEPNLIMNPHPSMGSEDFAFMLQKRPGCYLWIGNGTEEGGCMLHNPHYDFNDEILPIGATYWVKLAETILAK